MAMLFEDREQGGMGKPSLEADYADMVTRSLTLVYSFCWMMANRAW